MFAMVHCSNFYPENAEILSQMYDQALSFQWWYSYNIELTGIKSYKIDLLQSGSVAGNAISFPYFFSYIYQINSKSASVFKSSELVVRQYMNLEILTRGREKANSGKENFFSAMEKITNY